MNMLIDMYDPDVNFDDSTGTPVELHSLTLNDITVSAAGAEITGTGDFTFDNDNLETFGGMPAPTGAIDMNIVGVNGLMDRLIKMGLFAARSSHGRAHDAGPVRTPRQRRRHADLNYRG